MSDVQVFSVVVVDKQHSGRGANGDVANVANPIGTVNSIGLSNERDQVVNVGWVRLGPLSSIVEEVRVGNSGHGEGSSAMVAQV